jgi:hypothetical protein
MVLLAVVGCAVCQLGCGGDTAESPQRAQSEPQAPPPNAPAAPITVTATGASEPGGYAVQLSIVNNGPDDIQFDQVKTYYYGEGDMWGATLHEMEGDQVAVYYIYKNSPQPPSELPASGWRLASGQRVVLSAPRFRSDFADKGQQELSLTMGFRGRQAYGPFRVQMSSPGQPGSGDTQSAPASGQASVTASARRLIDTNELQIDVKILNTGTTDMVFDLMMTSYYADGQLAFGTLHFMERPGIITSAFLYPDAKGDPNVHPQYQWRLPPGKTKTMPSQVQNYKNFVASKQQMIKVLLFDHDHQRYGPFNVDLPIAR